jgi:hypothetical protein
MAFRISEMNLGTPKTIWMPVDGTDTLYVGQLVQSGSDGVLPLGSPDGPCNTDAASGVGRPFGVVVGTNYRKPVYDSTWKTNKIVGVAASATQDDIEKVGGHGFGMAVGDSQAKVEVAIISPDTVLVGPIYNAAYGTAPTEETLTGASTDGGISDAIGHAAADFTHGSGGTHDFATWYFRSGTNAGAARISSGGTNTAPTFTHGFPNATISIGDTCCPVNCRMGLAKIYTDSESMYIDNSAALTEHFWYVNVVAMRLDEAGKEVVHFMFTPDCFLAYGLAQT